MEAQQYQDFEVEHRADLSLVRDRVRIVDDFPKAGIKFCDITPALADPKTYEKVVSMHLARIRHLIDTGVNKVVGMEARGFIMGPVMARELGAGFVPARKPGKLPAEAISQEYGLEYGSDTLEIHRDAISEGDRVLIVDDLIATGGTAAAVAKMVESLGAEVVGELFMVELDDLNGRRKQANEVLSVLHYTEADLASELEKQRGRDWKAPFAA